MSYTFFSIVSFRAAESFPESVIDRTVIIVDDVISTGESLAAIEHLVELAGGVVCGKMTILAEGDAQDREDLVYLEKLPLFNPDGTVMG